jgi:hypothetical protein
MRPANAANKRRVKGALRGNIPRPEQKTQFRTN